MATTVIMPKVDMDQETGKVVEWLKREGDLVEKGEPILVIETDKVAIDVEAPASGTLRGIRAKPDDDFPIGTIIAYILEPGEDLPDEAKLQDSPTQALSQSVTPTAKPVEPVATPVARNIATTHNIDLTIIEGTGLRGMVTKQDVQTKLTTIPSDRKVYATPAARQIARKQGVNLENIAGSGPGGRIQVADVLAEPVSTFKSTTEAEVQVIPLRGMRRTIAERMTASYQTTPHITFTKRVDMSRSEQVRARLNSKAKSTDWPKVSVTSFLAKVVAEVLKRHPFLNSTLQEDGIHLLPEVNLGVAVALEEGLIVPVIHNANHKGIGEIASELGDLKIRARQGKLRPTDVAGGTFTISNLGPFGIEQFTAIINPPQAAILAVGATQREVVADELDQIVTRPIMRMTLCVDHRVVDGAVAAHFLSDLRELLEMPELLLW